MRFQGEFLKCEKKGGINVLQPKIILTNITFAYNNCFKSQYNIVPKVTERKNEKTASGLRLVRKSKSVQKLCHHLWAIGHRRNTYHTVLTVTAEGE